LRSCGSRRPRSRRRATSPTTCSRRSATVSRRRSTTTSARRSRPCSTSSPWALNVRYRAGVAATDRELVSLRHQTARDAICTRERVGTHALARADAPEMAERFVAGSFLRRKGLERPAVIVMDLPDPDPAQRKVRMHLVLDASARRLQSAVRKLLVGGKVSRRVPRGRRTSSLSPSTRSRRRSISSLARLERRGRHV
jgi:hypothetical protein